MTENQSRMKGIEAYHEQLQRVLGRIAKYGTTPFDRSNVFYLWEMQNQLLTEELLTEMLQTIARQSWREWYHQGWATQGECQYLLAPMMRQ